MEMSDSSFTRDKDDLLPEWLKEALENELRVIDTNPDYLIKWDDVKKQFID